MSNNTPNIEIINVNASKETLLNEIELVLNENNDQKKGALFERFVSNLFQDFAKLQFEQFTHEEEKKQIDVKARNNGLLDDKGEYLWIECKHSTEIGAPICYKHAGQLWLSGKTNTHFIFSLGGFTDTAMQIIQQMETKEDKRLVLVNLVDLKNFLKDEREFKEWIKLLCIRADECGKPGSKLPELNITRTKLITIPDSNTFHKM